MACHLNIYKIQFEGLLAEMIVHELFKNKPLQSFSTIARIKMNVTSKPVYFFERAIITFESYYKYNIISWPIGHISEYQKQLITICLPAYLNARASGDYFLIK